MRPIRQTPGHSRGGGAVGRREGIRRPLHVGTDGEGHPGALPVAREAAHAGQVGPQSVAWGGDGGAERPPSLQLLTVDGVNVVMTQRPRWKSESMGAVIETLVSPFPDDTALKLRRPLFWRPTFSHFD